MNRMTLRSPRTPSSSVRSTSPARRVRRVLFSGLDAGAEDGGAGEMEAEGDVVHPGCLPQC